MLLSAVNSNRIRLIETDRILLDLRQHVAAIDHELADTLLIRLDSEVFEARLQFQNTMKFLQQALARLLLARRLLFAPDADLIFGQMKIGLNPRVELHLRFVPRR